jgi:rhodanese-related sulfurtransferase/uncharacterized protein YciI
MTIFAALLGNGHVPAGDLLQPHLDFLTGLRARGIVLGNGRLIDGPGGLILLQAPDEATAREILSRDPFLVHGIRTLDLYRWDAHWAAGTAFPPYDPAIAEIAADWLEARLDANPDAFVLDVREDEEVARGTAPRTVHIPLGRLEQALGELPDGEVFVICRGGGRSLKACRLLAAHGRAAINIAGGMTAYSPEKA